MSWANLMMILAGCTCFSFAFPTATAATDQLPPVTFDTSRQPLVLVDVGFKDSASPLPTDLVLVGAISRETYDALLQLGLFHPTQTEFLETNRAKRFIVVVDFQTGQMLLDPDRVDKALLLYQTLIEIRGIDQDQLDSTLFLVQYWLTLQGIQDFLAETEKFLIGLFFDLKLGEDI